MAEPVTIKTALLVSAAVSYFLTPIVALLAELAMERAVEWFWAIGLDLDAANVLGAVGFLLGVIGMELVQYAVDVIRGQRILSDLLTGPRWAGG